MQTAHALSPATDKGVYVHRYLDMFRPYLNDPNISEICVNRPGELWIERAGAAHMEQVFQKAITNDHLMRLARQIARLSDQVINLEHPLLSASLPTGERIQIIIPPVSPQGVTVSIRKQVLCNISLEDYAQKGAFSDISFTQSDTHHPPDKSLKNFADRGNFQQFLSQAIAQKKNMIISGGTSSGKTTFLNALLKEIDLEERIITIEDTAELKPAHKNHLSLLVSKGQQGLAKVSVPDLLEASLRLRPDRILLGELRGKESYGFLRAINTGHPGSLTTIHADTPYGALEQIALMVMQAGLNLQQEQIITYIRSIIDIVIQLKRINGKRIISEIWYP